MILLIGKEIYVGKDAVVRVDELIEQHDGCVLRLMKMKRVLRQLYPIFTAMRRCIFLLQGKWNTRHILPKN